MKSKIEINISVIDDGPVVMRCQGQNTSKGKALDALEDAYLSTVAQLMRKDLSKAEQEEAAKEFGETMQDRLLAMVRGKGKRYMVSSEKEMSFMTELMQRQGGGAALTYEEYRRELNEALEKADWMNPRDKNGPAYRVLARAARDKALPLAPAEVEKRIQTVLQAPAMPESWERRRAR